jgi:ribokinase
MAQLVVIGSYNRDSVLRVPRLPLPGETLAASAMEHFHGGKGSNQAVAAARAGASVALAAAIGADAAGEAAFALWAEEGIATGAVRRRADAPTGQALILLDDHGENEIILIPGANATLREEEAVAAVRGGAVVVAQLETPQAATRAGFRAARAVGAVTLLNAAPAEPVADDLLAVTDILIVNETEARRLAGREGKAAHLAAALAARTARGVVVTAGAAGAFWAQAGMDPVHVPAVPTEVTDSTGAGDAFVGVLAAALAEGLPMPAALRRAAAAGALACRRLGAVPSLPRRSEILAACGETAMRQ